MPSIKETELEMVQLVLPEHANVRGTLYGGRMMDWITTAATMAAMRLAKGAVLLASMDDLDFLHPISIGDVVTLRARVEFIGTSSMEVGVEVFAEDPARGDRRLTTASHLAMVAVDERAQPRPVGTMLQSADDREREIYAAAQMRKRLREAQLTDRREQAARVNDDVTGGVTHSIEISRIVFPEDAVLGTMMFAGRLMMLLDEVTSILALRFCRCPIVTASIDALSFYSPIRVGEIVVCQAALNHVGRTSMEVGIKALAEHPLTGARRHTCTAFLTMVHVDREGPKPVPAFSPSTAEERRRWDAAERRRKVRLERRARLTPESAR
ncbi:MAG: acyl-CoA thioesterase [bacterium]